ncbi:response regulator [soil metagenome]
MSAPRILVVDDNLATRALTTFVLDAAGLEVASAVDADSATAQLVGFAPDLILMDIQLPSLDGLQLARRIKADPATRHIVIIAFTAFAMKGDEAGMLSAGCDGYIAKPFDVVSFPDKVRSYLPTAALSGC